MNDTFADFVAIDITPSSMYWGGDGSNVSEPNSTISNLTEYRICQWILYRDIPGVGLHIWDVLIALPNLIFLFFLMYKFRNTRQRFQSTLSPVMFTFYMLVCVNIGISLLRCVLSMIVNATTAPGRETDIIFWILVRFFLLSTEISVVVFCLAFGHLDSRTSIKRVLLVTASISLIYSFIQGTLEFIAPDMQFYVPSESTQLFGHGGMVFWSLTSGFFAFIYLVLSFLPWMPFRNRITLPAKPTFYRYCFTLFVLNLVQAIGSALYHRHQTIGICIIDVTTYLYFTMFTPLVYWSFLATFFSYSQSLMFTYQPQLDDGLDDNVITPGIIANPVSHQLSCSSIKSDGPELVFQPKLPEHSHADVRIGDVKLSFYESSLIPESVGNQSVNS